MNEKARYYGMRILAALLTFGLFYIMKNEGITKYIVVLAISGVFFVYGMKYFDKVFLIFLVPSLVYIVFGIGIAGFRGTITFQSVKEIAFAVIPWVAAVCFYMVSKKTGVDFIKWQYWSMVLLTITWLRYYYVEDILETQYSFIFGVFLLYFCLIKKDIKYILFTTLMLYLMNKRIAMLASVVILIVYDFIRYAIRKKEDLQGKVLSGLSIFAMIGFAGYVAAICILNLEGQFMQDLTSGRSVAWKAVKDYYQLTVFWAGKGLGDVVNCLGELQFPSFTTNLHNDLLKVYIEIGSLGYLIWLISHFYICGWVYKKRKLSFGKAFFLVTVMIYTLLNYMTDNIMVYINYWFPAYLVIFSAIYSDEQKFDQTDEEYKKEQKLLLGVIVACCFCVLIEIVNVYMDYKNPSKFTIPQEAAEVYSPEGVSRTSIWVREGQPYYRFRFAGDNLIEPSILGVETNAFALEKDVELTEIVYQDIVRDEDRYMKKDNPIKSPYQPVMISMEKDGHEVKIELRVYDYGTAFRYHLPSGTTAYEELTQMRFAENSTLEAYDKNAVCQVEDVSTEKLEDTTYTFPLILKYENGRILEISESISKEKNASTLTKTRWKKRTVTINFSEDINGSTEEIVTPWRVFLAGNQS